MKTDIHLKQLLLTLIACSALISVGCSRSGNDDTKASSPRPQSIMQGNVQCIYSPDGTTYSYFDIIFDEDFQGNLPGDVDSIAITGPGGPLSIDKTDFRYYSKSRAFWIHLPGEPHPGAYTFTAVSGDTAFTTTDIQSENRKPILADLNTFLPDEGATVYLNDAVFSWDGGLYFRVKNDIPACYQLRIYELNGDRVFGSNFVNGMLLHHVPEGILKPDTEYEYQVQIADSERWEKMQNRSSSRRIRFRTAKSLDYRYRTPEKTDDGWAVSSLSDAEIDQFKITHLMNDLIHKKIENVHSLLLVRNGKLVLDEYLHGYTRKRKHPTASMAKSITSILIGIAGDRKVIKSVDQKVYSFFPEHKGTLWVDQKYDISLKHILNMTAGTDWDEITYLHPHPKNSITGLYSAVHPIDYVLNYEMKRPPGTTWNYNSGLTVLLGGIIKNTTGEFADEFAQESLFGPLGISDYHWFRHTDGTLYTHGDLLMKPRDMVKIGYLMLNSGQWKGKQIVSEYWTVESTRRMIETGRDYQYGYQWRSGTMTINGRDIEGFWASGMGGQKIYVFPKLDLVAVMTSQVHDNLSGHERNESMLANYILPAVLPPEPPRKIISLSPEDIDSYTGKYRISRTTGKMPFDSQKMVISVVRKENDLLVKMPDGETAKLFPLSPDHFFVCIKGIGEYQARVIRDDAGKIKGIQRKIGFRGLTLDKIE